MEPKRLRIERFKEDPRRAGKAGRKRRRRIWGWTSGRKLELDMRRRRAPSAHLEREIWPEFLKRTGSGPREAALPRAKGASIAPATRGHPERRNIRLTPRRGKPDAGPWYLEPDSQLSSRRRGAIVQLLN